MTLTDSQKQKIRAALYATPTNKELADFTGKAPNLISQNRTNGGQAHSVDVLSWKIDKVCDACDDHEEVMEILSLEPSAAELARHAGVSAPAICIAKRRHNEELNVYAYNYHLLSWKVEKIAEAVGA